MVLIITPLFGLLIIAGAYFLYVKNENILENLKKLNRPLYNFLLNKWYFDEIYDFVFTRPAKAIGSFFWNKGDIKFIDGYGPNGLQNNKNNFSTCCVSIRIFVSLCICYFNWIDNFAYLFINMSDIPILTLTIFIPLIGVLFLLFIKGSKDFVDKTSGYVAQLTSIVTFWLLF